MSEKVKRPVGRPSELNADMIECAWAYVKGGFRDVPNLVPSVAGLAFALGKSRNFIYECAKENSEFNDILSAIATTQEMMLIDGTLGGDFNAPFAKLLMTKHGYSDKTENSVSGSLEVKKTVADLTDDELAAEMARYGIKQS